MVQAVVASSKMKSKTPSSFVYNHVDVVRVIDGDTVRLNIDMGNNICWAENFRLKGVDTPERGTQGALEATKFLKATLAEGVSRIETFKPDKFGRWLADIHIAVDGGDMLVNQLMITEGFGVPYFGGKKG